MDVYETTARSSAAAGVDRGIPVSTNSRRGDRPVPGL